MKKYYLIEIFTLIGIMGCSPSAKHEQPSSCLKAIVTDEVEIPPPKKNFYWGRIEVKYDPELAPIIFQKHSKKSEALKDPKQVFTCRIFFVPNGDYLDGWTSRHCVMQAAVADIKYFIFDDSFQKKEIDYQDPLRDGWRKLGEASKELSSLEDWGAAEFLGNFAPMYLHFNAFNSRLYSHVEQASNSIRLQALYGESKVDPPTLSPYYSDLFRTTNAEQNAFERDLCATDYTITDKPSNLQQVCFSISDMTVLKFKKPSGLQIEDFKATDYQSWSEAQKSLEDNINAFIVTEAAYRLASECRQFSKELEKCSAYEQISKIFEAGEYFTSVGVSRTKLYDLAKRVYEITSDRYDPLGSQVQLEHRNRLLKSFSEAGRVFQKIWGTYKLEGEKLGLAGFFWKKSTKANLMGLINFQNSFRNSTTHFAPRPDGFMLFTDSSDVIFEEQDSGSVVFVDGFPLAVLSTVNGESSAGGRSSTGDVTVAVLDDIVDPDINKASPHEIAQQDYLDNGSNKKSSISNDELVNVDKDSDQKISSSTTNPETNTTQSQTKEIRTSEEKQTVSTSDPNPEISRTSSQSSTTVRSPPGYSNIAEREDGC